MPGIDVSNTLIIDLEKISRIHHINIPGASPPIWGIYPGSGYSWSGHSWILTADIPAEFEKWTGQAWRAEIGVAGSVMPPGVVEESLRTMTVKDVLAGTVPTGAIAGVSGQGAFSLIDKFFAWINSLFK